MDSVSALWAWASVATPASSGRASRSVARARRRRVAGRRRAGAAGRWAARRLPTDVRPRAGKVPGLPGAGACPAGRDGSGGAAAASGPRRRAGALMAGALPPPGCPVARLPGCPVARLPGCPVARLPGCPVARPVYQNQPCVSLSFSARCQRCGIPVRRVSVCQTVCWNNALRQSVEQMA